MAETHTESDERLASILHDWWWNEPLAGLEEGFTDEAAAMADMRSLLTHLREHGYVIVPDNNRFQGIRASDDGPPLDWESSDG